MRQLPPVFGETLAPARIAQVLGLEDADLDARFPVQEVSTGLPCIATPLKSLDALKRCKVNRERHFELIAGTKAKAILAFSPEPYVAVDLSARFFADCYGVPEDPATGSANGCLAAYLVEHRYFREGAIDVWVEQGHEVGRPSLLYLRAEKREDRISVSVGGKVQMVARGEFL